MSGHMIYPNKITEVVLGSVEIEGYTCRKQCMMVNGYIAQGEMMTIYFDCPYGPKGDDCAFLEEFLRGEAWIGLKKKRGDKQDIINDIVEAIEDSTASDIKLPFKINIFTDHFTPEQMEKFFLAFLGYDTELSDVEDNQFVIHIKREVKRRRPFVDLKDKIKKFFLIKDREA